VYIPLFRLSYHAETLPVCNSYYLFTLLFLSKQTKHGRNIVSFYFFLLVCCRVKCLSREPCVNCLVLQLQSAEVER